MSEHTLKFYGDELAGLKAEVVRLGGLAEQQVEDAVAAFARRDVPLAQTIVGRDLRLDDLQRDIEKKAIRIIALRQPVAQDLRRAVGALKMSLSLERTGDLAKNIAKRAVAVAEDTSVAPLSRSIERMGKMVAQRLRNALDAYAAHELSGAMEVWAHDEEVDESYNALFRELLTYMMSDPRTIASCAHLLFIGKNLERIGDHATNIAEIIHYEITGEEIEGERPKWQDVDLRPDSANWGAGAGDGED